MRAEALARWRFEPVVGIEVNEPELRGAAGSGREWWVLPRGAELGPGRFGRALWPAGSGRAEAGRVAPASRRAVADTGRLAGVTNPTDSRLNLGAHDWTLECWLWLDTGDTGEGVIFEVGSGPAGANELVTRFSVLPQENAFVLAGLAPVAPGAAASVGRRIEFSDPAGPPDGVAQLEHVTLGVPGAGLPRRQWMHVLFGHDAAAGVLRLFLGGRLSALAPVRLMALPRGPAAYVALGCDGRRERVLPGALDELRVSDHAAPGRDFTPPETPEASEHP